MCRPFLLACRLVIVVACLAFTVGTAHADSAGPLSPSSVVDDSSVGTITWANPGNATASDDSYATISGTTGQSHYLKSTGYGFSIPTGATINGIMVEYEKKGTGAAVSDAAVRIVKGGTIGSTDRSASTWSGTEAYVTYGSSSDLWGETWTVSDINGSGFGAAISGGISSAGNTGSIDHVRITVYYTPAAVPDLPVWAGAALLPALYIARKYAMEFPVALS